MGGVAGKRDDEVEVDDSVDRVSSVSLSPSSDAVILLQVVKLVVMGSVVVALVVVVFLGGVLGFVGDLSVVVVAFRKGV